MAKVISIDDPRYERIFIDSRHYFIFRNGVDCGNGVYRGVLDTYDVAGRNIKIRKVRDPAERADVLATLQRLVEHESEL